MNDIVEVTKGLTTCSRNEVAVQMMIVFRSITPQFYKSMSDTELKAEMMSIQLLTQNIDQQTLAEMCRLAVSKYGLARSLNDRTYFGMNYLMQFFIEAFNNVHCLKVKLPKGAELKLNHYDEENKIITEIWEKDGVEYQIAFIDAKERSTRHYSPKVFESLYTDIDEIK